MRNGTRSNKLTLVGTVKGASVGDEDALRAAQDFPVSAPDDLESAAEAAPESFSPILVLFTVSLACASAALAAGSYALWLSRQKAARQTLTDVQDILRRCQERMHQMEDDLNRLPSGMMPSLSPDTQV